MMGLGNLIRRNSKLFFKDKAMFFTSLITPIILLVLYTTFLGNVYKQSFLSAIPTGFELPEKTHKCGRCRPACVITSCRMLRNCFVLFKYAHGSG